VDVRLQLGGSADAEAKPPPLASFFSAFPKEAFSEHVMWIFFAKRHIFVQHGLDNGTAESPRSWRTFQIK